MGFREKIELICEKLTKLKYYQLMIQLWMSLYFDLIALSEIIFDLNNE